MDRDTPAKEDDSALEQFRQEWRQEVHAKTNPQARKAPESSRPKQGRRESTSRPERPINKPPTRHPQADVQDDDGIEDEEPPKSRLIEHIEGLRIKETDEDDFSIPGSRDEPQSALEHYERAVEKESQGNLGDSLSHYRKAYRLDAKVDQSYRNKHFPGKWKHSAAGASTTNEKATEQTQPMPEEETVPKTFDELINSYANLPIPNVKPIIPGDKEPPCPISRLPTEVLFELLRYVAIRDPSVFARMALVCRRLAYHVFRENSIWKRVALGPEFGFAGQQYNFVTDVKGREAIYRQLEDGHEDEKRYAPVTETSFSRSTDFREVFHSHPRIRFSGVYISTVNYTRAGGVSATPGAWHSSVHIVTYYRYLRFYRDGTVISLLNTAEPLEVVHHLSRENLELVRPLSKNIPPGSAATSIAKDGQGLPTSVQNVLKNAQRGRWRLCHPSLTTPEEGLEIGANLGVSGDIHIETEGAAARYTYTMHLALKNGSRSKHVVKNNKLVWKGFWKYNTLTDDWAEFGLKNDKAFFFARVRSYGLGY